LHNLDEIELNWSEASELVYEMIDTNNYSVETLSHDDFAEHSCSSKTEESTLIFNIQSDHDTTQLSMVLSDSTNQFDPTYGNAITLEMFQMLFYPKRRANQKLNKPVNLTDP
jgi:hypothetical protein